MRGIKAALVVILALVAISGVRSEQVNEIACKQSCRQGQSYDCRYCCLTLAPSIYTDGRCDTYWGLCYCNRRDDLYRYSSYYGSSAKHTISWMLPLLSILLVVKSLW